MFLLELVTGFLQRVCLGQSPISFLAIEVEASNTLLRAPIDHGEWKKFIFEQKKIVYCWEQRRGSHEIQILLYVHDFSTWIIFQP